MQWQETIQFLGGATAISLVVGYIGKAAIEAFVNGRIEAYKSELQRVSTEHSITFQKLHTERAEVIKNIYAHIAALDDSLTSTLNFFQVAGQPSLEEKVAFLAKDYNRLSDYFFPNKIFLTENVCNKIATIINQAHGIFIHVTAYPVDPQGQTYQYDRQVLGERHAFWEKARNAHTNEFKQVKTELELEFRKIIGVAT